MSGRVWTSLTERFLLLFCFFGIAWNVNWVRFSWQFGRWPATLVNNWMFLIVFFKIRIFTWFLIQIRQALSTNLGWFSFVSLFFIMLCLWNFKNIGPGSAVLFSLLSLLFVNRILYGFVGVLVEFSSIANNFSKIGFENFENGMLFRFQETQSRAHYPIMRKWRSVLDEFAAALLSKSQFDILIIDSSLGRNSRSLALCVDRTFWFLGWIIALF